MINKKLYVNKINHKRQTDSENKLCMHMKIAHCSLNLGSTAT